MFDELEMALSPTFIPFTPWTTREGYIDLLNTVASLNLVDSVSPVQLALRLLLPPGSRLLDLPEVRSVVQRFDEAALLHRWSHADPRMDALADAALQVVHRGQKQRRSRREIFAELWALVTDERVPEDYGLMPRATIPYMDEPWYC